MVGAERVVIWKYEGLRELRTNAIGSEGVPWRREGTSSLRSPIFGPETLARAMDI